MKHWSTLLVPVAMGLVAAFVNWMVVKAKVTPESYVMVTESVEAGDVLTEDKLARIQLSGDLGQLRSTAVPYADRAVLYQLRIPRSLAKGDLVLWRNAPARSDDSLPGDGEVSLPISLSGITVVPRFVLVGQEVGFLVGRNENYVELSASRAVAQSADGSASDGGPQYLGPYRVLGVGERVTPGVITDKRQRGLDERTLTVAAQMSPDTRQLDLQSARLLSALAGNGKERVLGIVLHAADAGQSAQNRAVAAR